MCPAPPESACSSTSLRYPRRHSHLHTASPKRNLSQKPSRKSSTRSSPPRGLQNCWPCGRMRRDDRNPPDQQSLQSPQADPRAVSLPLSQSASASEPAFFAAAMQDLDVLHVPPLRFATRTLAFSALECPACSIGQHRRRLRDECLTGRRAPLRLPEVHDDGRRWLGDAHGLAWSRVREVASYASNALFTIGESELPTPTPSFGWTARWRRRRGSCAMVRPRLSSSVQVREGGDHTRFPRDRLVHLNRPREM